MFFGSYVALVTPFTESDGVDQKALAGLVNWQIEQGTEGLVVCGSTGEGFSLTQMEHRQVIETTVQAAEKRVPIIAGAGSMTTAGAIALAQQAEKAGAQGLLIVTPPYLKPTQEGLYAHFKAIEASTNLPLIIYNHPGRTGTLITNATMVKLAGLSGVVGVKDSTDDLGRPLALTQAMTEAKIETPFCQLSGDDGTVLAFLAQGGRGGISTIGNLVPALCARLHKLWQNEEPSKALALQAKLYPLFQQVFSEVSPACLKAGLAKKGFCRAGVRAPLQSLSPQGQERLDHLMEELDRMTKEGLSEC